MKKVQSGQGATDFGSSTGLTPEQLMGRIEEPQEFEVPPELPEPPVPVWTYPGTSYTVGTGITLSPPPKKRLDRERVAALIHIELVKDEISQGTVKSIGFLPAWIDAAADVIVAEYS